jgi:hypothetical protein
VWRDLAVAESAPKKNWAWYCQILDYVPFNRLVLAKIDGEFIEKIPRNHWSEGVRTLPQAAFDRILELARCTAPISLALPNPQGVSIEEAVSPLILSRKRDPLAPGPFDGPPQPRYSRSALIVGRQAEEIVHRYLKEHARELGARNIRWIAAEGSTPGWDLQYETVNRQIIAVEVNPANTGVIACGWLSGGKTAAGAPKLWGAVRR